MPYKGKQTKPKRVLATTLATSVSNTRADRFDYHPGGHNLMSTNPPNERQSKKRYSTPLGWEKRRKIGSK